MTEAAAIKAIIQGGAVGIAVGLMLLLGYVLRQVFRGRDKQDQKDTAYLGLIGDTLRVALEAQNEKFGELTEQFSDSLNSIVEKMQANQEAAITRLIDTVSASMATISERRDAKLDAMHTDLRTVPAETVRLIQQAFNPLFGEIDRKIDALPGTEATRRMIRDEISVLQQRLAAQIAPLLDRLGEIGIAVAALNANGQEPIDVAKESAEPPVQPIAVQPDSGPQPAIVTDIAQKGN